MDLPTAVTFEIGKTRQSVVTAYEIGVLIFHLYFGKQYNNEKLSGIKKRYPNGSDVTRIIDILCRRGVLQESKAVRNRAVFSILGRENSSPEELAGTLACTIDPFAYESHMSAMEWHGLTSRIAKVLFLSSPRSSQWRKFAREKMEKDLGDPEKFLNYQLNGMPLLRRLGVSKIRDKALSCYSSLHLGAFISLRDSRLRVSTVGRTFLDMIREPDLCGGIYHVVEVYSEHAKRNLQLVVDEIDRHGTNIDKVRAGYLLEERLGLPHPAIKGWVKFAQRGGSRKLYAGEAYSPTYSEKWCLSINVEI